MTIMLLVIGGLVLDEGGRRIAAMVAQAMKRADITQDYVARCTGIPPARLSRQLSGDEPFTGLIRILGNRELCEQTDLWLELTDLFASAIDRALAPRDYSDVLQRLARIEELIGRPRMARMEMETAAEQEQAS